MHLMIYMKKLTNFYFRGPTMFFCCFTKFWDWVCQIWSEWSIYVWFKLE